MPRYTRLTPDEIAARMARKKSEYRSPDYRKRCPGCDRVLPRGAFYLVVARHDGCSQMCRPCESRRVIAGRQRRREMRRILVANGAGHAQPAAV